jgi:hypothetical protein
MILRIFQKRLKTRAAAAAAVLALGAGLAGCGSIGDSMSTAFADPARYELYDCKQLEAERKTLASRAAEQQGLMAKAETGVAGPVVAELAYRNEAIAIDGQRKFAEEAWRKNKCHSSPPAPATPATSVTPSAKMAKGTKGTHPAKDAQAIKDAQPTNDAQPGKDTQPPSRSGTAVY